MSGLNYHLLWKDATRFHLEDKKFTLGNEYLIFATRGRELRDGKAINKYKFTDPDNSVFPANNSMLAQVKKLLGKEATGK